MVSRASRAARLLARSSLTAAFLATPACAGVLGIDEKQFDPDAAVVDAVAPVDGNLSTSLPDGNDAAPRGTGVPARADGASGVPTPTTSGGTAHDAAVDPRADAAIDARVETPDAAASDAGSPTPVPDASEPIDASPPPPPPSCADTCQPENVVTVLCIGSIACTYDVCAPFPGGGSYLDCDGDRTNGCEASPTDPATCGSCTNACSGGRSCVVRNGRFMCRGGGGG
jgi:hypothetical protein